MRKMLVMVAAVMLAMTADAWAAKKTGTIVSLDQATKTFICQWGGEDRAYKTTDKTVFRVGPKSGTWSDLKMGERVTILYRTVGKDRVADRVTIEKR
jgi:maltoporin